LEGKQPVLHTRVAPCQHYRRETEPLIGQLSLRGRSMGRNVGCQGREGRRNSLVPSAAGGEGGVLRRARQAVRSVAHEGTSPVRQPGPAAYVMLSNCVTTSIELLCASQRRVMQAPLRASRCAAAIAVASCQPPRSQGGDPARALAGHQLRKLQQVLHFARILKLALSSPSITRAAHGASKACVHRAAAAAAAGEAAASECRNSGCGHVTTKQQKA